MFDSIHYIISIDLINTLLILLSLEYRHFHIKFHLEQLKHFVRQEDQVHVSLMIKFILSANPLNLFNNKLEIESGLK